MTPLLRFALRLLAVCAIVAGPMSDDIHANEFSYDDWNNVLERFVDDNGLVDYAGLREDRTALDRFIQAIETQGPETTPDLFRSREDKLAYYINAYNALVFQGVLSLSPTADTVWGFTGTGLSFFVRMKVQVDGNKTSLKALEDDLIRDGFQDPRIHAALNCASVGCPKLPRTAFEPATLDEQLDAEMRKFVAEERNCRVDGSSGTVYLSKIFDWFRGDFEEFEERQGGGGLIDYINRYRPPHEKIPTDLNVEFLKYDKSLNRQ
jgi:hypothetical protein